MKACGRGREAGVQNTVAPACSVDADGAVLHPLGGASVPGLKHAKRC